MGIECGTESNGEHQSESYAGGDNIHEDEGTNPFVDPLIKSIDEEGY